MDTYLFHTALLCYVVCSLGFFVYITTRRQGAVRWTKLLLLAGLAIHTTVIGLRFAQAGRTPVTSLHESLSFFAWSLVGIFALIVWRYRADAVGILVTPLAALFMIAASFQDWTIRSVSPALESPWLPIHVGLSFAGEAVLGVACAAGAVYLVQERRIKRKGASRLGKALPSLEILDEINYRCLSLGFPLLTAGIITGSFWASNAWGSYWTWDPKETWALITWIIYAALLHQRFNAGWRGRRTAVLSVIGFAFICFTFLGVNLLLTGLHSYAQFNG
jgi:cytochrome c-type biogenesis protein CcsB